MKNVLELDISNNLLTKLPESFGQLVQLQRLDLYENKLTELPVSFAELERLRWLDLKKNPLNVELAKAAGDCVSAAECKECAKNVSRLVVIHSRGICALHIVITLYTYQSLTVHLPSDRRVSMHVLHMYSMHFSFKLF